MSEIEKHNVISVDSSVTARPATEHDTGKEEAAGNATGSGTGSGNGNGNAGEKDDDIRGRPGVAAIKPQYLLNTDHVPSFNQDDDDAAEGRSSPPPSGPPGHVDGRSAKRQRTDTNGSSKDKKKNRGQNKNRPIPITREPGPKLCRAWELGRCERGEDKCAYQHGWKGYFEEKPRDVRWPERYLEDKQSGHGQGEGDGEGQEEEGHGYAVYPASQPGAEEVVGMTIDLATKCPVLTDLGYCPFGFRCRFAGAHVARISPEGDLASASANGAGSGGADPKTAGGWRITADLHDPAGVREGWKMGETNWPDSNLLTKLRTDKYDFPLSRKYLSLVEPDKKYTLSRNYRVPQPAPTSTPAGNAGEMDEEAMLNAMMGGATGAARTGAGAEGADAEQKGVIDGESEQMDVPLRPEEKKRLDWREELYLAPLTTVGNLPFRRLCTTLGASITVSEMALAQPLISGQSDEWALCRRHASEKTFGIQLAGGYPNRMVPAAEVIAKELGHNDGSGKGVDFVDVNLGCPIDLVFNQGAGSALMDTPGRLGKILVGMNRALGDSVASGKPNAHKLVPRFATEWGASGLTLHGRSRQQRYSKLANWAYIKQCVDTLHAATDDAGLPRVPMFGNGDCYSAQQYWEAKEESGVDGVLVARGALIKPWIFTEIKERREWDISASERLEIVKQFAEFGLSHWGSDHLGIQTTRRFLCEYLSFTHRYIPIGLLERMPPQMNERPPPFKGRSELETLLASGDSRDWVKISEMFLGKVGKDGWGWLPKHKSNAYGGEEAQG